MLRESLQPPLNRCVSSCRLEADVEEAFLNFPPHRAHWKVPLRWNTPLRALKIKLAPWDRIFREPPSLRVTLVDNRFRAVVTLEWRSTCSVLLPLVAWLKMWAPCVVSLRITVGINRLRSALQCLILMVGAAALTQVSLKLALVTRLEESWNYLEKKSRIFKQLLGLVWNVPQTPREAEVALGLLPMIRWEEIMSLDKTRQSSPPRLFRWMMVPFPSTATTWLGLEKHVRPTCPNPPRNLLRLTTTRCPLCRRRLRWGNTLWYGIPFHPKSTVPGKNYYYDTG